MLNSFKFTTIYEFDTFHIPCVNYIYNKFIKDQQMYRGFIM